MYHANYQGHDQKGGYKVRSVDRVRDMLITQTREEEGGVPPRNQPRMPVKPCQREPEEFRI